MKKRMIQISGIGMLALVVIASLVLYLVPSKEVRELRKINNFEECVVAQNPVMESYPRQCEANGETFVEDFNAQRRFVSIDLKQCALVKFICEEGRRPFFDESGCGCEKISLSEQMNLPERFINKAIEKSTAIPVEGFDPALYKGVFPNLIDNDFDNAKAFGGVWKFFNNNLSFVKDESEGITSADGTLTNEGILTLITNLERRLNIKVINNESFDRMIESISKSDRKLKANYCTLESRNAEVCTLIYLPVCGWSDPAKVQCIKYPCAATYASSCQACADEKVMYYTEGECPKGQ